ncbi:MAG TPA: archease [Blastocatellia bacterium]|jgi:SHS2 domain-containing protein
MVNKYWNNFIDEFDVGVRGVGSSLEEAFEEAAVALTAIMTDPEKVELKEEVAITCEAPDLKLLLVEWLNALIRQTATRKMLFSRFDVELDGLRLRATARGEVMDAQKHELGMEPKKATTNDLMVGEGKDGEWIAQCAVDLCEPLVLAARTN